jgi:hypothetical protein
MSYKPFKLDDLFRKIQDIIISNDGILNPEDQLHWVKTCVKLFQAEALPNLQTIQEILPRYEFYVDNIQKDCDDIATAQNMDHVVFVAQQVSTDITNLFHLPEQKWKKTHGRSMCDDWDQEACVESIVTHMKNQVRNSNDKHKIETCTILGLHLCNTFVKQLRLLCGSEFKPTSKSSRLSNLLTKLHELNEKE